AIRGVCLLPPALLSREARPEKAHEDAAVLERLLVVEFAVPVPEITDHHGLIERPIFGGGPMDRPSTRQRAVETQREPMQPAFRKFRVELFDVRLTIPQRPLHRGSIELVPLARAGQRMA